MKVDWSYACLSELAEDASPDVLLLLCILWLHPMAPQLHFWVEQLVALAGRLDPGGTEKGSLDLLVVGVSAAWAASAVKLLPLCCAEAAASSSCGCALINIYDSALKKEMLFFFWFIIRVEQPGDSSWFAVAIKASFAFLTVMPCGWNQANPIHNNFSCPPL